MSGFLLLLVKVNLAIGVAIILVSLIRRPLRAQFGAPIAYAIWLLVPIAAVASLLPRALIYQKYWFGWGPDKRHSP